MSLDPNQRKDVRKAEKLAEIAEAARIAYTRHIMSEPQGREWMWNLLERCHVFHTPFARGQPDLTAFNCGEQNIGYQTFKDIIVNCPTEYVLMAQEASIKELTYGRRTQQSATADAAVTSGEQPGGSESRRNNEGSEPLDDAIWGPEQGTSEE